MFASQGSLEICSLVCISPVFLACSTQVVWGALAGVQALPRPQRDGDRVSTARYRERSGCSSPGLLRSTNPSMEVFPTKPCIATHQILLPGGAAPTHSQPTGHPTPYTSGHPFLSKNYSTWVASRHSTFGLMPVTPPRAPIALKCSA